MGTPGVRRGRATDPDRRERIARAAMTVISRSGVDGLTHRAVAAEADVPLGSTTYHFATLDDLLAVALQRAADDNIRLVRTWASGLPVDADLASALADLVVEHLNDQRPHTVVEYDLYIAALHRPSLRALSNAWDEALIEIFSARTDAVTGRVLAAMFCGLLMQGAIADPPLTVDGFRGMFRRVLDGPGPA
ncbi:TetR family transcriptional regulator [Actinomycetospora sp. NBRC 106378]|uniref:TetR/AcrR family transcriptional regulator n=1 Tax=Actinomycetospora sp. NBRC 106378 TaxID=3032208 RepID=UPI0024A44259|nr:TetR family transcriptional regulator [Actinomycetospora sp. NBRC 106378]GLZ52347.1 TetR family transcriptional regulator [Actinomycetospora sp. NBRC 106378]